MKPLSFSPIRFSLIFAPTTSLIFTAAGSTRTHILASVPTVRSVTRYAFLRRRCGIGTRFQSRPSSPRRVSVIALLHVLLRIATSKLTSLLFLTLHRLCHTKSGLVTLTAFWVLPHVHAAFPRTTVSPRHHGNHVRSYVRGRGFYSPTYRLCTLPQLHARWRLALKRLHRKPAIPGLDKLFTSIRDSSIRFARQLWFIPPPRFREASNWSRIDRPASGLVLSALTHSSHALSHR